MIVEFMDIIAEVVLKLMIALFGLMGSVAVVFWGKIQETKAGDIIRLTMAETAAQNVYDKYREEIKEWKKNNNGKLPREFIEKLQNDWKTTLKNLAIKTGKDVFKDYTDELLSLWREKAVNSLKKDAGIQVG